MTEILNSDPKTIAAEILKLQGGVYNLADARQRGRERGAIINETLPRLLPILNTNTVSTDLKRTVIQQQMVRAFAIRVLPLMAFSTVFNAVRLEGTDTVSVPYFPLNTTASVAWNASNGYRSSDFANSNSDAKLITCDKRQWQGLKFGSDELARQPFMNIGQGMVLVAEQLALDVVNDILSIITLANFGAAVHSQPAGAFDSDDVVELKGVADGVNWPVSGRSLVLNSTYDINLLKDSSVKNAMNFGDSSPIQEGRIKNLLGFQYFPDARVPGNSENLEGFITHRSAVLVAFAPIGPSPEVRQQLLSYDVVVEPSTGVTLEFRAFGDPTLDVGKRTVEANYGKAVGEAAALKRITNQ